MNAALKPGTEDDWEWVAPLAEKIFERAGDPQNMEYVRAHSHLLVGDGEFLAFKLDSRSGERYLWVWVAHGKRGARDFVARHCEQIAAIARDCGAVSIRFATARKGFMRSLGQEWRAVSITYEWRL